RPDDHLPYRRGDGREEGGVQQGVKDQLRAVAPGVSDCGHVGPVAAGVCAGPRPREVTAGAVGDMRRPAPGGRRGGPPRIYYRSSGLCARLTPPPPWWQVSCVSTSQSNMMLASTPRKTRPRLSPGRAPFVPHHSLPDTTSSRSREPCSGSSSRSNRPWAGSTSTARQSSHSHRRRRSLHETGQLPQYASQPTAGRLPVTPAPSPAVECSGSSVAPTTSVQVSAFMPPPFSSVSLLAHALTPQATMRTPRLLLSRQQPALIPVVRRVHHHSAVPARHQHLVDQDVTSPDIGQPAAIPVLQLDVALQLHRGCQRDQPPRHLAGRIPVTLVGHRRVHRLRSVHEQQPDGDLLT